MGRIYTPEEPIPAAVVTLATSTSPQQHILFQTRYDVKGYYTVKEKPAGSEGDDVQQEAGKDPVAAQLKQLECVNLDWGIRHVTVNLMRNFNFSQAMIYLTCQVANNQSIPPLPRVDTIRGGNYPFLTCEDEIRIYAGYVGSPHTPITPDMLDELPIDVDREWDTLKPTGKQLADPSKKLVPIFWGFIDQVNFDASSRGQGFQCMLSCRDRVRVFADTVIISIPSLGGFLKGAKEEPTGGSATGRRDKILADIARAANGWVHSVSKEDQKTCWKPIITPDPANPLNEAQLFSLYENLNEVSDKEKIDDALSNTIDPARWMRTATHKIMDITGYPRFHMWVQRPPLAKEAVQTQWHIQNRTPLDLVQQMAMWEERATDFFASHVNGDFVFGPRNLDTSGFYDKQRMFRTYFFRSWPTQTPDGRKIEAPCVNQQIISFSSYTSTVGTGNRLFIIDSSNSAGGGASVLKDVQLTADISTWSLEGRNPTPPCRNKIIMDGNIGTYANPSGGALLVALGASRQLGRDLQGCQMTVFGDPTWYPNEAARVYNTILHDQGIQFEQGTLEASLKKAEVERQASEKYSIKAQDAPESYKDQEGQGELAQAKGRIAPSEKNSAEIRRIVDTGTVVTDRANFVLPVYKARFITHKLTTQGAHAGFTTEISLVGDY